MHRKLKSPKSVMKKGNKNVHAISARFYDEIQEFYCKWKNLYPNKNPSKWDCDDV